MMTLKIWKSFLICTLIMNSAIIRLEARPQNSIDQSFEAVEADLDDQSPVYDLNQHSQNLYPILPLDRLQMLISRYNRPTSYLRSPPVADMNGLYRLPESKRQVRYRQCYFNPISCFKK